MILELAKRIVLSVEVFKLSVVKTVKNRVKIHVKNDSSLVL